MEVEARCPVPAEAERVMAEVWVAYREQHYDVEGYVLGVFATADAAIRAADESVCKGRQAAGQYEVRHHDDRSVVVTYVGTVTVTPYEVQS